MSKLIDERDLLSKPGDTILETIEYIKMSQVELAERMGKTASKINDIISGKEPITMNTALKLEKVLGIDAQFWLNREMLYREKLSRIEQEEELEHCLDWLRLQPIKELKTCGYIKSNKIEPSTAEECLKFYGVASTQQWEIVYANSYFSATYRKSQSNKTELGSVAAWLRIGELQMRNFELPPYNKEKFKQNLVKIRKLIKPHPEDFALQLQDLCLEGGVLIIYTPCISKAPISGAVRWIGGNPIIQLTDRNKSNSSFWFTFYHEAGHILLHGKKDIFIEEFKGYSFDEKKEDEANEFAVKWLLPEDITNEIPLKITEDDIKRIARKHDTHPAIVLRHLQHLGLITTYSFGTSLIQKVNLTYWINKK